MKIIDFNEVKSDFFDKIEFENIQSVAEIISDVRRNGDFAVKKYAEKFDNCHCDNFLLSADDIKNAYNNVERETIEAIKFAIENVKEFAQAQLATVKNLETHIKGNILGHKIIPIDTVGCYIPGGNYPLPSTAVMTIVPAKVAGVKNIIACSPKIPPVTIVAADLAGADKIYGVGGVQAIAAMAYGTKTIDKVNKIVGPGNKYVTSAKKMVYGECGIDFLAGPSEVMIVADETANPKFVAADMLAQCEHDIDARAYLLCFSNDFALQVEKYANEFLNTLATADIAKKAFGNSFAVIINNVEQAISLSDKKAPEHLELCFENAEILADKFTNYGSLFIGNYSAEVFGDYASGTNHTLPTNQVAKYSGGLSVFDYIKIQTYQIISKNKSEKLFDCVECLTEQEGLKAHQLASVIRRKSIEP